MGKQVRIYNLDIEYDIIHRDIKYPRLEFKTGKLHLILPRDVKDYNNLIEKHKDWIYTKMTFINNTLRKSTNKMLQEKTDNELRKMIYEYITHVSEKTGIYPNRIYFRKMKTKWGSCSSKRNITFNTQMRYLPDELIKYIVLHEMIHLIERKHTYRFWKIISKWFPEYEEKENDLFIYWFLTQQLSDQNK